jgi:hypothetical protein
MAQPTRFERVTFAFGGQPVNVLRGLPSLLPDAYAQIAKRISQSRTISKAINSQRSRWASSLRAMTCDTTCDRCGVPTGGQGDCRVSHSVRCSREKIHQNSVGKMRHGGKILRWRERLRLRAWYQYSALDLLTIVPKSDCGASRSRRCCLSHWSAARRAQSPVNGIADTRRKKSRSEPLYFVSPGFMPCFWRGYCWVAESGLPRAHR